MTVKFQMALIILIQNFFSDVLNIAELGRWWRVGAAVVVKRDEESKEERKFDKDPVSPALLKAAKKLRMNTDNKVILILFGCF